MLIENINYLSQMLFDHCFLFVLYFMLNTLDFVTGTMKAHITQTESSKIGEKGIIKKLSSWILLFISFMLPLGFKELGHIMNINFQMTQLLGWFTLVSLIVNEVRSISENLVSMGCKIPSVFTNGLEIANNKCSNNGESNNETDNRCI